MTYPKPIPAFTPDSFRKTLNRVQESTVPNEQKEAVNALREKIQNNKD